MVQFLKNLFGLGGPSRQNSGLYLYVKPKACAEILEVRVDVNNGPSLNDDGNGYYLRKLARGQRCPFEVEIEISFDKNKRIIDKQIAQGEFVTEADYQQFVAQQASAGGGGSRGVGM